jgi:hypothetical protein
MVQLADPGWTLRAMHLACAMASRAHTSVVLVRMVAVPHIGLVGEDMGEIECTSAEHETIHNAGRLASDYGVDFQITNFQFFSLTEALADAAAYVNAQAVFAQLPAGLFPYWHKFKVWTLRHKLTSLNCQLYTLEASSGRRESISSVLAQASHK